MLLLTRGAGMSNSFGTFLESLEKYQQQAAPPPPLKSTPNILPIQIKILSLLSDRQTRRVSDLMREHKIALKDGADAIDALREARLVSIAGGPGDEEVTITDLGLDSVVVK
jgi:hypothetical protein